MNLAARDPCKAVMNANSYKYFATDGLSGVIGRGDP